MPIYSVEGFILCEEQKGIVDMSCTPEDVQVGKLKMVWLILLVFVTLLFHRDIVGMLACRRVQSLHSCFYYTVVNKLYQL